MAEEHPIKINVDDAPEHEHLSGERWGGAYKVLTPSMRPRGGKLGVNRTRLPPGRALCPFHQHQLEDEVFYILSGRGWLRYGDELMQLAPGDCVSCPAGTGVAHQIANPYDEDLVYLSIGNHEPDEICVYPDAGKVMVRSIGTVGYLEKTDYMQGEAEVPPIFALIDEQGGTS